MIDKHLIKLRARDVVTPEEEAVIRGGVSGVVHVRADRTAVRARQMLDQSTILLSGIAARQRVMLDGRRQFTEIHVPGDFVDLHAFTLKYLDHDVVALSDCSFATVPHKHLHDLTERHPHLTRLYWFGTNLDAVIHREWVVSLGSRSAFARMAHLFCELYIRLEIVDLVRGGCYDLPLNQQELGEMLGITAVHVNRTLQELRKYEMADFAGGVVTVRNLAALKSAAEFDPAYLYLGKQAH